MVSVPAHPVFEGTNLLFRGIVQNSEFGLARRRDFNRSQEAAKLDLEIKLSAVILMGCIDNLLQDRFLEKIDFDHRMVFVLVLVRALEAHSVDMKAERGEHSWRIIFEDGKPSVIAMGHPTATFPESFIKLGLVCLSGAPLSMSMWVLGISDMIIVIHIGSRDLNGHSKTVAFILVLMGIWWPCPI